MILYDPVSNYDNYALQHWEVNAKKGDAEQSVAGVALAAIKKDVGLMSRESQSHFVLLSSQIRRVCFSMVLALSWNDELVLYRRMLSHIIAMVASLGKFSAPPKQKVRPPNMGMKGKGSGKGKAQAGKLCMPSNALTAGVSPMHSLDAYECLERVFEIAVSISRDSACKEWDNNNNLIAGYSVLIINWWSCKWLDHFAGSGLATTSCGSGFLEHAAAAGVAESTKQLQTEIAKYRKDPFFWESKAAICFTMIFDLTSGQRFYDPSDAGRTPEIDGMMSCCLLVGLPGEALRSWDLESLLLAFGDDD